MKKKMTLWFSCIFLSLLIIIYVPIKAVGPVIPGQSLWCITKEIGSTVDVIESKIDALPDCSSQLDVIEASLIEILETVEEMDSQLDVIESKIDALPDYTSQLDVIEASLIETLETVEEMDSQLDVIESKIDALPICNALTSDDVSGGNITLDTPGNYCLAEDITADIIITSSCVSLDLNSRCLSGVISISQADNIVVYNGFVMPEAPGSAPDSGITIEETANYVFITNVQVLCADTVTNGVDGRSGITTTANDVQIVGCSVKSGSSNTSVAGAGNRGGDGIVIGNDATRTVVKNCIILTTGSGGVSTNNVGGRGGYGIAVGLSGSPSFTEIIDCSVLSTGSGGTGSTTGGDGGHCVYIGADAVGTAVRHCILRNSGSGGSGAASGEDGRAVNDLQTTAADLSFIFSNFASAIANSIKYNIQATGLESGVLSPNPPTGTVINPLANVYTS